MHTITLFAALSLVFVLSGAHGMVLGQLASVLASGLVFFGTLSLGQNKPSETSDAPLAAELSNER